MSKPKSPCRPDCQNRSATCHRQGECPEHDAYLLKMAAWREVGRNNKAEFYQFDNYKKKILHKMARKRDGK